MDEMRILLVDDHNLFRKGIAALLATRPHFHVVGEASDGLEALERARELAPDVILMDLTMPKCDGLEAARLIKQEMPNVHIIILTVSDKDHDLFTAIKNGADGYLLKTLEPSELYEMLDKMQNNEAPISGQLTLRVLQEFRQVKQNPVAPSASPEDLTNREVEILEMVVQGASNRQISETFFISENSVKIHLRNILDKLHLQNRTQAAVYAVCQGLIKDPTYH